MKNKLLKLLGIGLFTLAMAGCNSNVNVPESNVSEHGINVRSLGSGVDGDGHEYKTYAYVVVPSNSTTPIAASVSFADSRADGSNYLTATVDNAVKEFTITCLQAFDSQATVRIYATVGSAYAEVTVDYRQKLVSSTFDSGFTVDLAMATYWSRFSNSHHHFTSSSVYTISETFSYTGLKAYTLLEDGGEICSITNITQDEGAASAVTDIIADFDAALLTWFSYSIYGVQGNTADRDLFLYVNSVISNLSEWEKQVLGSAEVSGNIKINFTCSSLSHYYSSTQSSGLYYTSSNIAMSFNIPSSVYNNLGVYKNVQSITPEVITAEF